MLVRVVRGSLERLSRASLSLATMNLATQATQGTEAARGGEATRNFVRRTTHSTFGSRDSPAPDRWRSSHCQAPGSSGGPAAAGARSPIRGPNGADQAAASGCTSQGAPHSLPLLPGEPAAVEPRSPASQARDLVDCRRRAGQPGCRAESAAQPTISRLCPPCAPRPEPLRRPSNKTGWISLGNAARIGGSRRRRHSQHPALTFLACGLCNLGSFVQAASVCRTVNPHVGPPDGHCRASRAADTRARGWALQLHPRGQRKLGLLEGRALCTDQRAQPALLQLLPHGFTVSLALGLRQVLEASPHEP